jgi:hypothetical protein
VCVHLHTHAEHAHACAQTPRGEQEHTKSAREIREAVGCSHTLTQGPSRSSNAEKSGGPSPLCVTVSVQEIEEEFRKRQDERRKESDKRRIVTEAAAMMVRCSPSHALPLPSGQISAFDLLYTIIIPFINSTSSSIYYTCLPSIPPPGGCADARACCICAKRWHACAACVSACTLTLTRACLRADAEGRAHKISA